MYNVNKVMSVLSAIDRRDWYQVMDLYAQWAPANKNKCTTGLGKTIMPIEHFTSPWGIINFLRESGCDNPEYVRLQISTILSNNPEEAEKNAKTFSSTFKKLISEKKKNKNKRDKVKAKQKDKALENFLVNSPVFSDQKKENIIPDNVIVPTSNAEILIALAQAGAKLKSPDGWEVQF